MTARACTDCERPARPGGRQCHACYQRRLGAVSDPAELRVTERLRVAIRAYGRAIRTWVDVTAAPITDADTDPTVLLNAAELVDATFAELVDATREARARSAGRE
jgi:hypothetical protein